MTPPPVDREMTRAEMVEELSTIVSPLADAVAAELSKACEWEANEYDYWDTACNETFVIEDGGSTAQHGFRFCCYCGGTLVEVPFVPEPDDDEPEEAK